MRGERYLGRGKGKRVKVKKVEGIWVKDKRLRLEGWKVKGEYMFDETQLVKLTALIEESYGSSEALARQLDLAVELLFYVEEDTFSRREIQNVVAAIRGIVGVLRG